MGKENQRSWGVRAASLFASFMILASAGGCAKPSNKEIPDQGTSTISKEINNPNVLEIIESSHDLKDDILSISAKTKGYGEVGTTLRITLINLGEPDPDKRVIIINELGVPGYNDENRPKLNVKDLKEGWYLIIYEAKNIRDIGDGKEIKNEWPKNTKAGETNTRYARAGEVFYLSH